MNPFYQFLIVLATVAFAIVCALFFSWRSSEKVAVQNDENYREAARYMLAEASRQALMLAPTQSATYTVSVLGTIPGQRIMWVRFLVSEKAIEVTIETPAEIDTAAYQSVGLLEKALKEEGNTPRRNLHAPQPKEEEFVFPANRFS